MRKQFVLTLTGPDRIGFVERATGIVLEHGGNVATSRMARLGGAFAILMLVSIPAESVAGLHDELSRLGERGFTVTIAPAEESRPADRSSWLPFRIELEGADHEGIIHHVARYLSDQGINIETIESEIRPGSTSGVPLFAMTAHVLVPPSVDGVRFPFDMATLGDKLNVDLTVSTLNS